MGFALVNLVDRYIKRIPPNHFSVVKSEADLAVYKEALESGDLGCVPVKDARRVGPRPLRGRYKNLRVQALAVKNAKAEDAPPQIEEKPPEDPPAADPKPEDPPAEEPKPEEPKPEDPPAEEPKPEDPPAEEPKADEPSGD